jgi:hypothetical protein
VIFPSRMLRYLRQRSNCPSENAPLDLEFALTDASEHRKFVQGASGSQRVSAGGHRYNTKLFGARHRAETR